MISNVVVCLWWFGMVFVAIGFGLVVFSVLEVLRDD